MKIGVIGGGQLGRMLALAGTPLGMNFAFLDPARWGMAASAASVNLANLPAEIADPIWLHRQEYWLQPAAILCAQIVFLLLATRLALRRFEPGKE